MKKYLLINPTWPENVDSVEITTREAVYEIEENLKEGLISGEVFPVIISGMILKLQYRGRQYNEYYFKYIK
jgi:hypothetical protein